MFFKPKRPQPDHQRETESELPSFKMLLVGDGGVGKTTFVKRLLNPAAKLDSRYIATVGTSHYLSPPCISLTQEGVVVSSVQLRTHRGPVQFEVWDTAGEERFGGLRDQYYKDGACAILMFDVTNRRSYRGITSWYRDVVRVCNDIPIVLVGNKVDAHERRVVPPKMVTFNRRRNLRYYEVSARKAYNVREPLLQLARALTGIDDLEMVREPIIGVPPGLQMSSELVNQIETELIKAKHVLPDIPIRDDDLVERVKFMAQMCDLLLISVHGSDLSIRGVTSLIQ